MTKDDVMMLANQTAGQHWMDEAHIQRFAVALISAERDACAKVCFDTGLVHEVAAGSDLCFELEALIRARGNQ